MAPQWLAKRLYARWHENRKGTFLPIQEGFSQKGARPMPHTNRPTETSSPKTSNPELEALVIWMRSLSAAEFEELSEAIANQDVENLSRFDAKFKAFRYRSA